MSEFIRKYVERAKLTQSVLCVGLDPTPAHVPPCFKRGLGDVAEIRDYLYRVIELASQMAPVVKPQYAYYGALGTPGIGLLIDVVRVAHDLGLLVILDAKRADIGETMEQYAREVFDVYGVDACTFVPYLGSTFLPAKEGAPSWLPWLERGKGIISMIITSNPEAKQFQMLELASDRFNYQAMADIVSGWAQQVEELTDGVGMVGGVVGATKPEQAVEIRERVGPNLPFLIPGYGAQGGGAEGAVAGFPPTGELHGFVNSSRGITLDSWFDRKAGQPREGDPLELVAAAIEQANAELNAALTAKLGRNPYEAAG